MKNSSTYFYYFLLFCGTILLLQACSAQKDSGGSSNMQNLTAHFNILYNAGEMYKSSEAAIAEAVPDDYGRILTLYKEPTLDAATGEMKRLDSILVKTNTIISEKAKSNYVDDAWFLTGQVNYLKTNFFNAVEYFDYVYKTYPDEKERRQQALVWKARSLMRLNEMTQAADALDTAIKYIATAKKYTDEVYAAEAQFNILSGNETNAMEMLLKALEAGSTRRNELRWTFILAQLEEKNGKPKEAFEHYSEVVKSNVSFEMSFQANLSRIRVEEGEDATVDNRVSRLQALLKENKNKEFADQIHYQVAGILQANGRQDEALQEYQAALKAVSSNQSQKGITYLKLAEINFGNADYVKAKAYYDSTLASLPPSYPGYDNIRIKSANLDLLAGRFREIAQQDTLQQLAKLPEGAREQRIGELVREQVRKTMEQEGTTGPFTAGIDISAKSGLSEGKFYFNNTVALSQGFSDFKRRWGNRKLEDNWRRGSGTAADAVALASNPDAAAATNPSNDAAAANESALRRAYTDNLPITSVQLQQSDQKIINAYYDIASFYKDDLKDDAEAVKTYELLLKRFPENTFASAIYYNLFRLYTTSAPAKAATYRQLLLSKFPGSVYAKVVLDPDFSKKADERAVALGQAYTDSYNLYLGKNYTGVLELIGKTEAQYGPSNLSSQFAYLAALATGRLQKIDAFEASLKKLADTFPVDQLVTPLVKQQLQFIAANREMLDKRPVALLNFDPNEPVFAIEPRVEPVPQQQPVVSQPEKQVATVPQPAPVIVTEPKTAVPVATPPPVITSTPPPVTSAPQAIVTAPPPLYSLPDSAEYYFVVNVADPRVNLNPSRFGIGQFNRSNFSSVQIRHDLKDINKENQLVYVGKFYTLASARVYESRIVPLMRDIMKVPAEKYNTFVITKTELDKLTTRNEINTYYDFYRKR